MVGFPIDGHIYVPCFRSVRVFVAPTVALIGHPHPCRINLTHEEAVAFTAAGIHLPDYILSSPS